MRWTEALLLELGRGDLPEWNRIQRELWSQLYELGYVEKDDYTLFAYFGKFFYNFVVLHEEAPTLEEVIYELGL